MKPISRIALFAASALIAVGGLSGCASQPKSYIVLLESPDGKAILHLQAELAHVTRNRDDLQTENNSMRRQMKAMQRKLDALEGKKAA